MDSTLIPEEGRLMALMPMKRKTDLAHILEPETLTKKRKIFDVAESNIPELVSSSTQTTCSLESTPTPGTPLAVPMLELPDNGKLNPSLKPRGPGGRPRTRQDKSRQGNRVTYLRKNKPVAARIPIDVWQEILSYCPPPFLIKAREVCRDFNAALAYSSTWKASRQQIYGVDQPGPPASLTEMQYCDLLSGMGCQARSCTDTKARKTYWAFSRRWCDNCLKQKTIMSHASNIFLRDCPRLYEIIRPAAFDAWCNYQFAGNSFQRPDWHKATGHRTGYERLSIPHAMQEISEFLARGPGPEEQDSWYATKNAACKQAVEELRQAEAWFEIWKRKKSSTSKELKDIRATYFQQKALTMEPPLELNKIRDLPSYIRAISISKPPSTRAWLALQPKLEKERDAAEKLAGRVNVTAESVAQRQLKVWEYSELERSRHACSLPEQNFVLAIAESIIRRLGLRSSTFETKDQDITHIVLRSVHAEYYNKDEADRPGGKNGPYRLLMDDAKMVYDRKILPIFSGWGNISRSRVANQLKCPGCLRRDTHGLFDFKGLMDHIHEMHLENPDFSIWSISQAELPHSTKFPWCRHRWPQNLPMLTINQKSIGRWKFNVGSTYKHTAPKSGKTQYRDAFESRCASFAFGHPGIDFVENALYVGSQLRNFDISSNFKTQIAFEFALQKYRGVVQDDPDFEILDKLQLALMHGNHYDLFENFRCLFCCEQPEPSKNNKFVNRPQPFAELIQHYRSANHPNYHPMQNWTSKLLCFPTAELLSAALLKPGNEEALRIFVELFPCNGSPNLDPIIQRSFFTIAGPTVPMVQSTSM